MTNKERVPYWDIVKAFLIFLVVLGHFLYRINLSKHFCPRYAFNLIYFFHMPAFVFVSGFFSKKSDRLDIKTVNKIVLFFLLAIFLKISISLVKFFVSGKFKFVPFLEDSAYWYLFALSFWYILLAVFSKFSPWVSILCSIFFGLSCGFQPGINSVLAASRIIVFFPFFLMGFYFQNQHLKVIKSLYFKIFSILFIIGILVLFYFKNTSIYKHISIFYADSPYKSMSKGNPLWVCLLFRLGWYITSFIMVLAILSLIPQRMPDFICRIGRNTLSVFFLHRLICSIFDGNKDLRVKVFHTRYGIIWAFLFTLFCTFVFSLDFFYYPLKKFLSLKLVKERKTEVIL